MATASLQPTGATSLWQPTFLVRASQSWSLPQRFFFLASPFGQYEATGLLYSDNFLELEGKRPFCALLCNPALVAVRVRRSRLGPRFHGLDGLVASVLWWGSRLQGPGCPASFPRCVRETWATRLSSMQAGGRETLLRGRCGHRRSLDPHLQADVEHHRGHDIEVGEVHAQPPGQVKEGEQRAREPLAEGAIGAAGRGRARQSQCQAG